MEIMPANKIISKVRQGSISAVQVVTEALARIKSADGKINSFNEVYDKESIKQAETVDKKVAAGIDPGRLAGIPVAIKDNICIRGRKTTCSSRILENYISPYDATVVELLQKEGAILIGKTNMDEFAMGSSTENSAVRVTKNPWNTEFIPGGSSGGSAAAVSSGMVPFALGSDTGGSIRQPAACCGVVGMKPTYGRVSRYGLVAFASSLDQIGPFAREVADCAAILEVLSGCDLKDSTSSDKPCVEYTKELNKDIKGLTIGIPDEYFISGIEPDVRMAVENAIKVIEKTGARMERVSLPHTEYAVAVYYIIAPSEASANLARYDGIKYGLRAPEKDMIGTYKKTRGLGFGPEVKRRIMLGTYALSAGYYEAYYGKAQKVRSLIRDDFEKVFSKVDALITPTMPTQAFKFGEKSGDPLQMYLSDIFTIPCNLAGLPGISLPCGFTKKGLPVGLQILGRPFEESIVLRIANAYENETNWHKHCPEA